MNRTLAFIEQGKKKSFAGAVSWPGWCRSGRDELSALQSLIDYGPRYARMLQDTEIDFNVPTSVSELDIVERTEGNSTTDFGAPAIILDPDRARIDAKEYERQKAILLACWQAFDESVSLAEGRELQKGPRGGGRDIAKIIDHVLNADISYITRTGWKLEKAVEKGQMNEMKRVREAIMAAFEAGYQGELPEKGPRGGIIWPPLYFVRRVAWHTLDHAWEVEDRII